MKIKPNTFITALLIVMVINTHAQQNMKLVPEKSSMKISGTSSLHDWEMSVEKFKCDFTVEIGNPSITIAKANFAGVSSSIKSHSSIMDKKAREALDAGKYPEIRFRLVNPLKIPTGSESFTGSATGELSIAGKTKTISLPFHGKIGAGNSFVITGSKEIDMTAFGIEPPTAMLGTLKTGKDVKISFTINLQSEQGLANN